MLKLNKLRKAIFKEWNKSTDIILLQITNDGKILDYNKKFNSFSNQFEYLQDLITYTHKRVFFNNLSKLIKEQGTLSFVTNFSFDPNDVEDIPYSYKVVLDFIEDDNIIVLAEAIPPLSHNDARSYFSMINEYSALSRKIQKSNFNLNKKNEELKTAMNKIEFYANFDHLTKIYNRRRIFEEMEKEYKKFERLKVPFSIAMLDIDDFKKVNDTYGHQNGDLVLLFLANEIKKMLREYDSFGRFGGEEFILLLPATKFGEAKNIVSRILEHIYKTKIELSDKREIYISFSAGVAQSEENKDLTQLINIVDEKLYKVKSNGKNQVI